MKPAALLTATAGIAIVIGLITAGGNRLSGASDVRRAAQPAQEATGPETFAPAQSTANPDTSMTARPVDDASQFYPSSVDGKPLEREQAPEPERKPVAAAEKGIDLPRPVAESAGILGFGERRLQLAGLTPTPVDKTCPSAKGPEWPCGMLAKTNFRLFLRLRTVNCDLSDPNWSGTATASCKIGTQDLSAWLIENGWAEAEAGSAFAEAGAKAKRDGNGIYGQDPRQAGAIDTLDLTQPQDMSDPL
ncbi:thermonuclease family protein [Rhizobium metallidurans]|uniref:Endonuclease YncB(Thermonuclease family) n=1 Tax=Rhizobium metallidurans TaxID=1265931 RepID=A0A7W6GCM6_9HYPH|nr:thermonuclease family protein [Rhizobium metallidurans]MBB3965979.1 endonuclease YncB(thermonuclease family) [Rhizobium metallidurans]